MTKGYGPYVIKCDTCKVEIGTTNSVRESAAGGYCSDKCRQNYGR